MTKLKLTLTVLMLLTAAAWGQSSLGGGGLAISCNAVTATGACTSFALQAPNGQLPGAFTWQVIPTGSPSAISTTLEGSIDGNTWTTLDTSTNTSGELRSVTGKPIRVLRCNLGTLTNGTNPTVTCQFTVTTSSAGGGGGGAGTGTVTNAGNLANNAVVLGDGGAAGVKTSTGITTNGGSELDLGLVGTSGVLGLNGTTSGKATITAPSVAGTAGNPFAFSNAISLPDGATATPALLINDVGLYRSTTTTWRMVFGGADKFLFNSTSMQPLTAGTMDLGAASVPFSNLYATNVNPTGPTSNGARMTFSGFSCGTAGAATVLSTVSTTTDTTVNCLPANSIIDAVVYRITVTITAAATNFTIGDATIPGRFCAAQSTLTANTTGICFLQADQTGTSGPRQVSAAPIRITTDANPGAGQIRIIVFYHTWTVPTG